MDEPERNTLITANGSRARVPMVIRGVELQQCPNCSCYHPSKPYFDDASYTFYDSSCWVAPERRQMVQGISILT